MIELVMLKRAVHELKSAVAKQTAAITKQEKQLEALTASLQKVSDKLELRKPAPQMVENNH